MATGMLVLSLWTGELPALGADAAPPPPSAAEVDRARAHFRAGESYYDHKMYPDAAREFEVAYRLSRRADLLYNIGRSWDSAGDIVRAARAYRQYLALAPEAADSVAITKRIAELTQLLAVLTLRVPGATARVTLDRETLGETPLVAPVELAPGEHVLEISRSGHRTWRHSFTAVPGERIELEAVLEPAAAPVAAAPVVTTTTAPPPLVPKTPVYKKWWLWTIVIGVVAAGAVATGVVLGTRGPATPTLRLPAVE